jgi:uncharacterized protein (TIGR02453 family)
MSFKGFGPQALKFLTALAFHQNKAWFDENRAIYEGELKDPMGDLVEDLSAALAKAKIPLRGDRKKAVFRIHRDTRFSKDKSPYKTNAGFVLNSEGTKNTGGMLYVHIDPKRCFTAAGWYSPEPPTLTALRRAIVKSPKAYLAMEDALAAKKLSFSDEWSLKRLPKGYEDIADERIAAAVKRKGLVVSRDLSAKDIASPKLIDTLVAFAKDAEPLLKFGWSATA